MSALSDRLLLMLVMAVGFGSILLALIAGYVEAEVGVVPDEIIYAGLAILLLGILVGAWFEFRHLDKEAD